MIVLKPKSEDDIIKELSILTKEELNNKLYIIASGDVSGDVSCHKKVVQLLLNTGADVNSSSNKYNITPLMYAAYASNKDIIILLINNGASINAKNRYGHTALDYAISNNNKDVIELLIQYGAKRSK